MKYISGRDRRESGFTIVELMIATLIFSIVLTVIVMGVTSFTSRYYKAVNASTTQTTAQTIVDNITQAIQFGAGSVVTTNMTTSPNGYFCAGGYRFTYDNKATEYDGSGQGITMGAEGSNCDLSPTSPRQLLGDHMRLTYLQVSRSRGNPALYTLELTIAYGDRDLMCVPDSSRPGVCNSATSDNDFINQKNIECKPMTGSEFCAVSHLTTSVDKRVVLN